MKSTSDSISTITINGTQYGDYSGGGNQSNVLQLTKTNYINEIAYSFKSVNDGGYVCQYLEFKTKNGDIIKAGSESSVKIQRLQNIKLSTIDGRYSSYVNNLTFTFTEGPHYQ